MNKEDRIRLFYYFVKGVLSAKEYKVSDDVLMRAIEEEIKEIESMKNE